MQQSLRSITLGILAVALLLSVLLVTVSAQNPPMNDEQIARIRANCTSAKNTLNRLHVSDALLRVNRGQIYESMLTKLMNRFNNRVEGNRLDAKDLVSATQTYSTALTIFRVDYQAYEEQLSTTLKIDCSKEPVSFYDGVATTRIKRAQVHEDVVKLHQYIDDYKTAFDVFKTEFNASKGVNN